MIASRNSFGGSRLRQVGWAVALAICIGLFVALTFKVNAVKSEVRLAERRIVALEREKMLLETEFETRASQQQLSQWNAVEFGYQAPAADQYLENERQLAALGEPRGGNAPAPIRVAHAPEAGDSPVFPKMVSPLSGRPVQHQQTVQTQVASLAERLSNGGDFLAEIEP